MIVASSRPETNLLAEIVGWASGLPVWQQDALRRIVENCDITADDEDELTRQCKWSNGIVDGEEPLSVPVTAEHVPGGAGAARIITLCSIAEAEHVNALDRQQELRFAPTGLTVIFGYNGSGKSGYGRILRRSCRARTKGPPILPDIRGTSSAGAPSAVITYAIDGKEQPPEQWIDSQRPVEVLGSVSFFDGHCAQVHVGEQNEIAFTPYGLDVLPKLAAAAKAVQRRLDAERQRLQGVSPQFLRSPIATGDTAVGRALKLLRHNTKLDDLKSLATLSDVESRRLEELPSILANDPRRGAQELRTRARRIATLQTTLAAAGHSLSNSSITTLKALAIDCAGKAKAAEAAAKRSFSSEPLQGIGEEAWRALWESARRFSALAYPQREFPVVDSDDARCVLCQQLLDEAAKDRLRRFEDFVCDDTAKQAAMAREALHNELAALESLALRDKALREQLADVAIADSSVHQNVRRYVANCLRRLKAIRAAAKSGVWDITIDSELPLVSEDLARLAETLQTQASDVEQSVDKDGRKKLEAELAELKAREWFATVLGDVQSHVDQLAVISKLGACIDETRTNKITAKSKALAKQHVTDRLRDAFATEIRKMHQGVRRLNVELSEAAGEYGSSCYRIRLVGARDASLETIVSEGEHRCIALAGFLAELATEAGQSAIVFDDPVTSLDHQWREAFARRLVEEGEHRQVIVFTHDIVFLHDLMGGAETSGVPISLSCVRAERDSCGIVNDGLPWIAQKTLQRIDELEKQTRLAQQTYDAQKDDEYELAIGRVYDRMRSTIERAVEECFFRSTVLRHRDYVNLKELKRVAVLTEQDCDRLQKLFKRCCDITEAHDRSSLRGFGTPTPADALRDLADLRAIIDDVKSRQRSVA